MRKNPLRSLTEMLRLVYNGGFAPVFPAVTSRMVDYVLAREWSNRKTPVTLEVYNLYSVRAILGQIAAKNIKAADITLIVNGKEATIGEDGTCSEITALEPSLPILEAV